MLDHVYAPTRQPIRELPEVKIRELLACGAIGQSSDNTQRHPLEADILLRLEIELLRRALGLPMNPGPVE